MSISNAHVHVQIINHHIESPHPYKHISLEGQTSSTPPKTPKFEPTKPNHTQQCLPTNNNNPPSSAATPNTSKVLLSPPSAQSPAPKPGTSPQKPTRPTVSTR